MKTITKEQIEELLRSCRRVRIGKTLFIGGDDEIQRTIEKAWREGKHVEENGTQSWIEICAETNPKAGGSARYTWHKDGNRVRGEKFLVVKTNDTITRHYQGKCWVNWSQV